MTKRPEVIALTVGPGGAAPVEVFDADALVLGDRFARFQALVHDGVRQSLEIDDHCKSYEGTCGVVGPSYFQANGTCEPTCRVTLACYVLGPERSYDWWGQTWTEAFDKAEADVRSWIAELREEPASRDDLRQLAQTPTVPPT